MNEEQVAELFYKLINELNADETKEINKILLTAWGRIRREKELLRRQSEKLKG